MMAVPNVWLYFLDSQLQHFSGRNRGEGMGRLFSHWSGRYLPCHDLETGGKQGDRRNYPTLALMLMYKVYAGINWMLSLQCNMV